MSDVTDITAPKVELAVKAEDQATAPPAAITNDEEKEKPTSATVEKASVDAVVDQFENMTVFGNKSLKELEEIQSKTSHLNAGILFDDPSLNM